jgi:ATPase subunit of ABC transporter with duplicated ATPase domains
MLVRLEGVSKAFGPKDLIKNASMQINDNDRIALVGPNGAGKTTLLRMITGEVRPDSGELTIKTNKIVYLSQFPPSMTPHGQRDPVLCAHHRGAEAHGGAGSDHGLRELPRGMDWNDISLEYARLQEEAGTRSMSDAERALEHLRTFGIEDKVSARSPS